LDQKLQRKCVFEQFSTIVVRAQDSMIGYLRLGKLAYIAIGRLYQSNLLYWSCDSCVNPRTERTE